MGYPRTHLSAQTAAASSNYFVVIGNGVMKNGAYTLSHNAVPEAGTARRVTITHATVAAGTDTLGVITVTGTNLAGQTISEVITPVADQLVTGTKFFTNIPTGGIVGSGWTAVGGSDTVIIGTDSVAIVAEAGAGTLYGVVVNTTANGTITLADASGTIAVLPANVAVGTEYEYGCSWAAYLSAALAAGSDITLIHSGSMPVTSYP